MTSIRLTRAHARLVAPALVALLGLLLVPNARFFEDDFIQLSTLEGTVEGHGSGPFDLYRFLDGSEAQVADAKQHGPLPWFVHERARVHFFRPLASALLTVEHAVWGQRAWGYQLTTLAIYLGLALLLGSLARTVWPETKAAHVLAPLAAALLFCCSSHWYVVAYLAARWSLLASTLGLAALVAHVRWRERGWARGRPLAVIAFVGALLAGEVAVAMFMYVLAYELVAGPGGGKKRASALAPFLVSLGLYLLVYLGAGYGSAHTGGYLDPARDPLGFLGALPVHVLALFGELLLAFPALLSHVLGWTARTSLAGLAGLTLLAIPLVFLACAAQTAHRRTIAWLSLGTLLSALPLAAALPHSRLLLPLSLGTTLLITLALHGWLFFLSRRWPRRRWVVALPLFLLVYVAIWRSPPRWIDRSWEGARGADAWLAQIRAAPWVAADGATVRTVFLTPDLRDKLHGAYARRFLGLPVAASHWMLSTADATHRYRRTGAAELELELIGGALLDGTAERQLRPARYPLEPGSVVTLDGLEVEALAIGESLELSSPWSW